MEMPQGCAARSTWSFSLIKLKSGTKDFNGARSFASGGDVNRYVCFKKYFCNGYHSRIMNKQKDKSSILQVQAALIVSGSSVSHGGMSKRFCPVEIKAPRIHVGIVALLLSVPF